MDLDNILARHVSLQRQKSEGRLYLFEIDFGICTHTSLADEIDDPLFAFIFGEVQSLRQIAGKLY